MRMSNTVKGSMLYLIAMFVTVTLNIFIKSAIIKFNLPTIEVLCCRQAIIVLFLLPLMIKRKFNFFDKDSFKPNIFRNLLFSISTFSMYFGMARVPLNDATAIMFLAPIIGSILATKLLNEKASKTIWIVLALAMIGVLVVKTPSFNDSENILFGYCALMIAVIIRGYVVILNKKLAEKFDTMTMLFYTHIIMLLTSLLFTPQFVAIPLESMKYIAGASLLFFIEYYLIFKAYKLCKVTTLQPLDFSRLLYMMIMSSLLLGETTNCNQIVGGLIIVSSYTLMLFNKKKK